MPTQAKKQPNKPVASLIPGLFLLLIASLAVTFLMPKTLKTNASFLSSLSNLQYKEIVTLALLAAITLAFLAYYRSKYFFSTGWFVGAAIYNLLILFVKFTLSPNEFANQNSTTKSIILTAILVSLLYVFVFFVAYLFFDGRLLSRKLHKALITSTDGKVLLAVGIFVFATLLRIIVFRLPILSKTEAASYLGNVFKTNTVVLSGVLFVMILAAVETFARVRRREDLKAFFGYGTSLILIFHLSWAIFIIRTFNHH